MLSAAVLRRLRDLIPVNDQISEVRMKEKKFYLHIEGKRIRVSEEVYREYYKGERKERYFMKDLKAERITIDPQTGEVTVIPGREDSYERLLERHRQFASYGSMEEQTVRSLLLEQALGKLTEKERELIEELYFLEKTERQVSDALHVAKTTLRRRHKEILDKLRNIMREEN